MIALYLISPDQASLEQALIDNGVMEWVDQLVYAEPETQIDEATGQEHQVGSVLPVSSETVKVLMPVQGYSVDIIGFVDGYIGYMCNLLGEFTDKQLAGLPSIAFPAQPLRVFGGWDNGQQPTIANSEVIV